MGPFDCARDLGAGQAMSPSATLGSHSNDVEGGPFGCAAGTAERRLDGFATLEV